TSLRIREMPAGARAPLLVMVTAMGRETLSHRPAHEQALLDGFLVKPVTATMLRGALSLAMGAAPAAAPAQDGACGPKPLAGLRLLVAEDNALNQLIARELLTTQGAVVDVVGDGRAAVERLRAGERYDLVLMDVLMPVMDGLSATRAIRGELGDTSLPIVAMTANAMDSDRAECLAAGMDDHIGKPFVLADVIDTIRRLARPLAAPPAAASSSAAARGQADDALLDRAVAIERMGGEAQLFDSMLPLFRQNVEAAVASVQVLVDGDPALEAQRLIHTLKGMAGTMGAMRLSRAAERAEPLLCDEQGRLSIQPLEGVLVALRETLEALPAGQPGG
ncbi:MAG TPA: response regulator, partial [Ramlibacter sp.]|nr:response regulator [Ramlibacter sp.]